MTNVHLYRSRQGKLRGFSVIGHADSAPSGEDIVCAGVSVLAQTAVNALESLGAIRAIVHMGDGFLSARLPRGLTARQMDIAQIILRTAQQGFSDMAAAYPHYVSIR